MDDTVDDEPYALPRRPLSGRDVALWLDPFGFQASTEMDWQKGALAWLGHNNGYVDVRGNPKTYGFSQ